VSVCTPTPLESETNMAQHSWIAEEEFNPGYMQRGKHLMPKQGEGAAWSYNPDYYTEKDELPLIDLEEPQLVYQRAKESVAAMP
jgi:hypothetical protein